MEIILRAQAKALDLKFYYTGKMCKYEHIAERYTRTGKCRVCERVNQTIRRRENPEISRERDRERYRKNPQHRLATCKASYEKNKANAIKTVRAWQEANPEKVAEYRRRTKERAAPRDKAKTRQYYEDNKDQWKRHKATRRAKKLDAQPDWVDTRALAEIYTNCPEGYEVDHEVPLNNKLVCGLHVPWNLKPIPKIENRQKSNKFDPETYVHTFP